jgi:peptide-methionine (S)-S-oxide reductase
MAMIGASIACSRADVSFADFPDAPLDLALPADAGRQQIVLAGGCFWCTEGVFERIPGVVDVVSGYAGDTADRANYDQVSRGATRHAEAIRVTYDPAQTSLGKLLKVFFSIAHDPTTLNRQGPDVGSQYRSTVFVADDRQREVVETYIRHLDESKVFEAPIVTTIEKLEQFYEAENYHQDYARLNPNDGYIRQQAVPKLKKADQVARELAGATTRPTAPSTQPAAR